VKHDFFVENNSSQLGVFWPRQGFQANHRMSDKVQYSRNQAIKISLNEAILFMSIFKIKICVFRVTET